MSFTRERQQLFGRERAAIALETFESSLMPGLRVGSAGIVHASHVVAAVGAQRFGVSLR